MPIGLLRERLFGLKSDNDNYTKLHLPQFHKIFFHILFAFMTTPTKLRRNLSELLN